MQTPDNRQYVARALSKIPTSQLNVPESQEEAVRRSLLPLIWNEFPDKQDWALMVKTERDPDFIPADILWYKPTGEHIDVSTTSKPDAQGKVFIRSAWTNNGINERQKDGRWVPMKVHTAIALGMVKPFTPINVEPVPVPVPPPVNEIEDSEELVKIRQLIRLVENLTIQNATQLNLIQQQNNEIEELKKEIIHLHIDIKALIDNVVHGDLVKFPTYTGRVFGASIKLTPEK